MSSSNVNTHYIKSFRAILKIVEFAILLAAFICMAVHEQYYVGIPPQHVFFYLVVVIVGLHALLFFFLLLCNQDRRMRSYDWNLCVVFWSFLSMAFLIGSSAVLAHKALSFYRKEIKENAKNADYYFDHLVAAVVLGFIAAVVFLLDTIIHLIRYRRSRKQDWEIDA